MKTLFLILFAWLTSTGFAKTLYITQSGTGTGTALSLANSGSVTWFNTDTNWGAGGSQVNAGDTITLNGNFTSSLIVPTSITGTALNPITILFATGATMSAPTWGGNAINIISNASFPKDYFIIDGGTNGLIECTANGTSLANQVNGAGVNAANCNHLTVKNLTIRNMYVRTGRTEKLDYGIGVQNMGVAFGYTDFTVDNCIISNCAIGIDSDFSDTSANYSFTNNTITFVNWGIHVAQRNPTASSISGVVISGNTIHDFANWDQDADTFFHHNGIFLVCDYASTVFNDARIFNNTIGPGFGSWSTAGVYANGYGMLGPILIYNNLFVGPGNCLISYGLTTNSVLRILNNTFIGGSGVNAIQGGGGPGVTSSNAVTDVRNNISVDSLFMYVQYSGNQVLTVNNNIVYGNSGGIQYKYSSADDGSTKDFAQWQALGFDTLGFNGTNPLLSGAYVPSAGSIAVGAGATLSAYFTTDKNSATRTVPWTIGAFNSGGISGTPRFPLFQRQSRGYIPR